MNRRTFLKWQMRGIVLAGTGLGLGNSLLSLDALAASEPASLQATGDSRPDVAVIRGDPAAAARAAVNMLGGMSRFVKPGQKVLIKPNMSFAQTPDKATTTHPEVVREILVMCKEAGAGSVRVLDHSLQNPALALQRSGILDACNSVQSGICHHLMDADFYVDAPLEAALSMRENAFMRDALEADVIIAAPVAKSHGSTGVSLSLKGQMGLILNRSSMHSRYPLSTSIVDLNTKVKPHLAVIDATRVLSTGGPGGPGKVLLPGEIIASADPVAADSTAVASYEWGGMRIAPRQVAYLREAHDRGLGRMDIENLIISRNTL
ncbi:MAG: DUF362 domain-containing protein [Deltaproteobacteria bacterium]|jgi:uncharacterized protein (DUF362 family)|nr:DUF362 domain-containing protein [Deltaproteobacteria bacterium]